MKASTALWLLAAALLLVVVSPAQTKPPTAPPQLSTADKISLQAIDGKKQEAQQMMIQATQMENAIEGEFAVRYPGWKIDQRTHEVVKDVMPPPPALPKPIVAPASKPSDDAKK